jgi:hypothetical protein
MSYSRRLENVLQQIETVENNLNKNLIEELSQKIQVQIIRETVSKLC